MGTLETALAIEIENFVKGSVIKIRTYVVDLETTDLRSDIGTLIVACFGELDADGKISKIQSRTINEMEGATVAKRERALCLWTMNMWQEADIIIGQNIKAFDHHFLQGVMMRHKINNGLLEPRIILDTYQIGKGNFAMGMSMANMVDIMGIGKKDAPSKDDWREANHADPRAMRRIKERCVSDVKMTAAIWERLKPLYFKKYGR